MRNINNNSNTVIIVLHEIYGINKHIKLTCKRFFMNGYDVICPDLTNINQTFNYNQEEAAYRHFIEDIGFESAFQKVKRLIVQAKSQYEYVFLVGFSVGATIAWLCSNEDNMCDGIIGYYGSRIRDYLELTPQCPVYSFFLLKRSHLMLKS